MQRAGAQRSCPQRPRGGCETLSLRNEPQCGSCQRLPDSSPPTRLLTPRPCCGPGFEQQPQRHPVLGEAPRFHAQAKGKNVRLDGHSRRATRRNSFCNGVTFTQRPIRLYEQVRLRLVAVRPGWSGALRFGFTAHDPSLMSAQDIPKYACPDLVTRPGYWAKALPESLALRDTVLAYWADRHGRVFYRVNDGEPVLFHCGVAVGGPLWALIDVYGITDEVQLLGTLQSSPATTTPSGSLSGSQDDSDSDMTFSVNQSSSESESSLGKEKGTAARARGPGKTLPIVTRGCHTMVCLQDRFLDTGGLYLCGRFSTPRGGTK
ncbi:PREDICTED: E3 ubiquitin-protein ligase NEURL1B [Dipodomys ordii]|uniref:E3 ubiquitin-protein ligase NEURL1B n=1 Tax=Dipodomys ordii TaxID=10020 RepID=A0A1S3F5B4_DIPOR|nr:PREDICTED: E3 ubiquitin-protein ligase NEURL1B [Dipodomys ordii]